jgi:hypothetical protein
VESFLLACAPASSSTRWRGEGLTDTAVKSVTGDTDRRPEDGVAKYVLD